MRTLVAKNESHFVDAFANFVRKFECSVKQIRNNGLSIHDRIESRHLKISGTREYGPDNGLVKLHGSKYPAGCWYVVEPKIILATQIYHRLHPFSYMAEGKFSHSFSYQGAPDVRLDMEAYFDFHPGTIVHCFSHGYYNNNAYKDCWEGQHWSFSAAFNVGRYMFNKHFVGAYPSIPKLPCIIPAQLVKVLT